jgi:hypothetical protein
MDRATILAVARSTLWLVGGIAVFAVGRPWLEQQLGAEAVRTLAQWVAGAVGVAFGVALLPAVARGAREIAADKATGDWRRRRE